MDSAVEEELTDQGKIPGGDDQSAAPVRPARDDLNRTTVELDDAGLVPRARTIRQKPPSVS